MPYKDPNCEAAKEAQRKANKKFYERHREERLAAAKLRGPAYYQKNKERILANTKQYYETHKEQQKASQRKWQNEHPEKIKEYSAKWRAAHPEENIARNHDYKDRLRQRVFEHYGNRCQCCGEERQEFFAMDHVHGGGNEHRRKEKIRGSGDLFLWIIRHDFPDDFRILCHNCNMSKGFYGYCPHEREPEYGIEPAC